MGTDAKSLAVPDVQAGARATMEVGAGTGLLHLSAPVCSGQIQRNWLLLLFEEALACMHHPEVSAWHPWQGTCVCVCVCVCVRVGGGGGGGGCLSASSVWKFLWVLCCLQIDCRLEVPCIDESSTPGSPVLSPQLLVNIACCHLKGLGQCFPRSTALASKL